MENKMKDNKYSELFESGNKAQLKQMIKNEHKEGWNDINIKYAYKRIKQKTRILWREIYLKPFIFMVSGMLVRRYKDHRSIRKEAANIANFTQMIILKCDKELAEY